MPISQINPDGTVKIYNTKTRQILDVKPDQLVNYSPKLLTDYNTMVQQNAENQQKLTGKTPTATQKDINMGKSGLRSLQTVAEEYQKDPNVLAKQLIPGKLLTRKFDSALFNTVDTILRARTGAQANKEEIAAYLNEKGPAFGDSPDVVQYKLNAIQQDLADAAGVKDAKPFAFSKGGQQPGPSVGGFIGNAGQDTKDLLNGVLGMPRNLYDQANAINQQGGQLPDARGNIGQAAANAATQTGALFNAAIAQPLGGILNEANQVTGRPFEGGDILGRMGQRAYQKPVTTLLDVLPALQGAKALKTANTVGKVGAVTKAVDETKAVTGAAKGTGLAEKTFASQFGLTPRIGERLKPLQVAKTVLDDGTTGSFTKMKQTASAITGKDGILSKTVRDSLGKIKADVPIPTDSAEAILKNTSAVSDAEAAKELANIRRITAGQKLAGSGKLPTNANVTEAYDASRELQKQAAFWDSKDTNLTPNPKAAKLSEAYYAAADDLMNEVEKAAEKEGVIVAKDPKVLAQLEKISPNIARKYQAATSVKDLRAIQAPYVRLSQMIDITDNNIASKTGPLVGGASAGLVGGGAGFAAGGPLGGILGYGIGKATQPLLDAAANAVARPMTNAAARLYRGGRAGLPLPKGKMPTIDPKLLNILNAARTQNGKQSSK